MTQKEAKRISETLTSLLENPPTGPDSPALFYGEATWCYAELRDAAKAAAAGLAACGIGPGDRVALWLPNVPAYLILNFACAYLGAIAVAVNTRFRSVEVGDIIERSGAQLLVYWPDYRGIDFQAILADIPTPALAGLNTVVRYHEGSVPDDMTPSQPLSHCRHMVFEHLLHQAPHPVSSAQPESGVNIFTTSGTTSKPKFVLHSQRALTRHARDVAHHFGYDQGDGAILQAMPLCGVFGYCQALAALASGQPMVMMNIFDAAAAVRAIDRHHVAHMNATDDMIWAMLQASDREHAFPSIKFCGYARFNTELADISERAAARGLTLVGLYGMSEVQALFALRQPDDAADVRDQGGGHLVSPEAAVRVRDPETGQLCELGAAGEIEVKGPSLMAKYDGNPVATDAVFDADGFIRTGDLGYLTGARSFVFLSRMGDVLRLGGFLVAPAEIEAHIQNHLGVGGCQVVGAETGKGVQPVAFVVAKAGTDIDPEAILEHCRAHLARYKVPAKVVVTAAFPTTKSANGTKIQRAKLRQQAQDLMAQENS